MFLPSIPKSHITNQANDWCFPNVSNMTIDGRPAYAIGDLLQRHPQDPTRWRVYERIDEQIMLSTGEKARFIFPSCRFATDLTCYCFED